MELMLRDKVVAITGGASGIGRAAAAAFLAEGCKVAVCGRSQARLADFQAAHPEALAFRADVTDDGQLRGFIDAAVGQFGRLDVWINNAGLSEPMPFAQTTPEAFDRMIRVNLRAAFFGTIYASEQLRKAGGGVVINTSSFTARMPTAGKALYGATKAAVESLTRSLAAELAADRIRVVSVIPGYIRTEMTEANIARNGSTLVTGIAQKRLGVPEDLAGAYVFLASDAARYITGVSLTVAGGKLCVQNPLYAWERTEAGRA
ncbi:MAG TPA: SDR family oxidoreductase [Clostridia bacterium]|nr:SDR family oxidoreductase [Clostridia bacterium]